VLKADEFTEQQQLALHFNKIMITIRIQNRQSHDFAAGSDVGQHILVYQRESSCHYVICRAASAPFTVIHFSAAGRSFSAHAAEEMLRKAVGKGAYEMAYSQQENALWVATSQSRSLDKGGIVYRLDPTTLDVTQIIHNDLKPFGAAINHATKRCGLAIPPTAPSPPLTPKPAP
jgi:hypothetical protein